MWTDTKSDPGAAAQPAGEPLAASYQQVTPDRIADYVARGRDLRAHAIARIARQVSGRVRTLFGHARQGERPHEAGARDPLSILAGDFKSPLTAIRSSAEILRDNPDLDTAKRKRFVDIVLMEEARLEALVTRLLDDTDSSDGSPVWRLEPDRPKLGQTHTSCP